MSVEVMTLVWEHSEHKGSALLVQLALANAAQPDGKLGIYSPGVVSLAKKCRLSRVQVMRILPQLEESGELTVKRAEGRGRGNTNSYTVNVAVYTERAREAFRAEETSQDETIPTRKETSQDETIAERKWSHPEQEMVSSEGLNGLTDETHNVVTSITSLETARTKRAPNALGLAIAQSIAAYVEGGGPQSRTGHLGSAAKKLLVAGVAPEFVSGAARYLGKTGTSPSALDLIADKLRRGLPLRGAGPSAKAELDTQDWGAYK